MHEKDKTVNLKIIIEYDGKNYFGWQRQKNRPTIQQTCEKALIQIFSKEKIKLTGSGRTDTGVHASGQTANFRISKSSFNNFSLQKILKSLNAVLPDDIAVKSVSKVSDNFHSRFSAKKRVYTYKIGLRKHAVDRDHIYFLKREFNIDIAKEFCKIVTGNHSFKTLSKSKTDTHEFKSNVEYAKIKKTTNGVIIFEICANRFLHSMVRAVTGAMILTASGKMKLEEFKLKFLKGDLIKIQYVPAKALTLKKVIY